MNIKGRMMAGAALAAGLLMTAPAMAQSDRYYNTNPTPAEQAQTNQLNDNAATQANQDANANDAAHADYDAKSAAYQQQLDRYRSQQEDYYRARTIMNATCTTITAAPGTPSTVTTISRMSR